MLEANPAKRLAAENDKFLGPTFNVPPMPTPPVTTNAPVAVVADPVDPLMFIPEADNVFPKALTPERT